MNYDNNCGKNKENGLITMLIDGKILGLESNNMLASALYLLVLLQRFGKKEMSFMTLNIFNYLADDASKYVDSNKRNTIYQQVSFNDLKKIQNDLLNYIIDSGYAGKKMKEEALYSKQKEHNPNGLKFL